MKRNNSSLRIVILIFSFCFVSNTIMAQKVYNDTSDIDQLNLSKLRAADIHKAVNMRKAGMILTFSGIGLLIASNIVGITIALTPSDDPQNYPWGGFPAGAKILIIGNSAGLATIVVGTPLWIIGARRINKVALSLKTFAILPENSMALGVGITFRF